MLALDAARSAGADYADVRFVRNRTQNVSTREARVSGVSDNETYGFGVRTLVNGAWGFAASRDLTRDETARVARQAVAQARANRSALVTPVVLAPAPAVNGTWNSPIEIDPFQVAIEDKVGLLLDANMAALTVKGARFIEQARACSSSARKDLSASSRRLSFTVQTIYRTSPAITVTAVGNGDFQTRESVEVAPRGLGYEHVRDSALVANAPRWADEAVQKLTAKSVDVGRYDLVLHPSHLWLTIHESVAHPTELDRAMGYEANYAGTSFVAPPEKVLGTLKYGSELMNIRGDRTQKGSLSACGWDDEGVKPEEFDIVKKGVFVDYHTTREQALWLGRRYPKQGRSHALPRLLLCWAWSSVLVPTHAQRLAAPRRPRISAGRISSPPPRSRHRDHRRQFLLHRSAAVQRARVRRPGLLRRSRAARSSGCSRVSLLRSRRRDSDDLDMIGGQTNITSAAHSATRGPAGTGERGQPRLAPVTRFPQRGA